MRYRKGHKYLKDFPANCEPGWSNDLQGVAHDDENWFFTQKDKIWKFPVTHDLSQYLASPLPDKGIIARPIPTPEELQVDLRTASYATIGTWYNHFGDLDCRHGMLYVPLAPVGPLPSRIAIFRCSDLSCQGSVEVKEAGYVGWCAIRAVGEQLLYLSDDVIDEAHPMSVYSLEFPRLRRIRHALLRDRSHKPIALQHLQGGVFSDDDYLYLVSGYCDDRYPHDGITVYEQQGLDQNGTELWCMVDRSTGGTFRYVWQPGLFGSYEEPEGLTIWDLDDGRAPGIAGQLHVIMIDNDWNAFSDDDFYFKHYHVCQRGYVANADPAHLEVHTVECVWAGKISDQHRVTFCNLASALASGFDGCYYCLRRYHRR